MRLKRAALRLAVPLLTFLVLLYACELGLEYRDPRRRLPPDGMVGGRWYTWGHPVEKNSLGFREREFGPKPAGAFRVMVLGDSLTWGAGLAPGERYTAELERLLTAAHPGRKIEVLNFGLPGAPTTLERDVLARLKDEVRPDLIIVGFCVNDPQPRDENYSREREAFERDYGRALNSAEYRLGRAGLPQVGHLVRAAAIGASEKAGLLPDVPAALARAYDPASEEWRAFAAALGDIKRMSDAAGLPPPVFAALNQGARTGGEYLRPGPHLRVITELTRRAEGEARAAGFVVVDFEREIPAEMPEEPTAVNALDGHPSARLNRLYAEKLFRVLEERYGEVLNR